MRKMMGFVLAGTAGICADCLQRKQCQSEYRSGRATTVPETQTEAAAETESGSYTVTDVRGKKIEY